MFILTEKQFDSVVTNGLKLLKTKPLSQISDEQHIAIIRASNRIWISQIDTPKYSKGAYAGLKKFLDNPNYSKGMLKAYPEWSPNRGMGMYFHKLNIEYGGTPCFWSMFVVRN